MSEDKKINSRVVGCLIKLVCFVLMVIAFAALIFFIFSGLSYFLSGERIELPQFSKMWSFVTDATDDFFNKVDDNLDKVESMITEESTPGKSESKAESQTDSKQESEEQEEGFWQGDWVPDTVTLDGNGGMVFSRARA